MAKRALFSGTTACVLHINDWAQLLSSASLIQAVKQSADVFVKSASDKLGKAGLQATAKVLEGHLRIAVAEYAKEWDADLVLVGSHGARAWCVSCGAVSLRPRFTGHLVQSKLCEGQLKTLRLLRL